MSSNPYAPYPDAPLSINGAAFRIDVPSAAQRAPEPAPGSRAQWSNIPNGGNILIRQVGKNQTAWSPTITILGTDAYNTIYALYMSEQAAPLVTRWGTFNAFVRQADAFAWNEATDEYTGPVLFEWS